MDLPGTLYGVQARRDGKATVEYRDDAYCVTREDADARAERLNIINEDDGITWEVFPLYRYG